MANFFGSGKIKSNGKSSTRIVTKGSIVTLRARKTADGSESLYLDYFANGKRQYEFLKVYLFNSKDPITKDGNKESLRFAESVRIKRELELTSANDDFIPAHKKKADFIAYYRKYILSYGRKDIRLVEAALNKFIDFIKRDHISFEELNENLILGFKEYLNKKLNGETPFNYFKKFKKVLSQSVKEDFLRKNPAGDIRNAKSEGIKKEVLLSEELQKLAGTPCGNEDVKRAALFSANTGLRWCDVKVLQWKSINNAVLKIKQQKTSRDVIINLNAIALKLIGAPGKPDDNVFILPSHAASLKNLRRWTIKADIKKKITYHCFRHTFGTNLILYGSDVASASDLLGHSNWNQTKLYVRMANSLKQKAVNNLPELSF